MGLKKNKTSVAIFYDGNYMGRVSKYYGANNIVKYKLNIEVLHNYIIKEVTAIASDFLSDIYVSSSHYFRSRHSASEAVHRKSQLYRDRANDDVLSELNITSHFTPFSTNANSNDDSYISNWLSLELLEETTNKDIDIAVLVAGSNSYLPLLNKLASKGIDTMVVGWDTMMHSDSSLDIKTCETIFEAADHTIVVNVALDQDAEGLNNLLTPIQITTRSASPSHQATENEEEDNGEREISEILTLKPNFGFIRFPNNNLFFRATDYIGSYDELKVGDTVEFIVEVNDDGQSIARKVAKVESNLHLFDDEDYKIDDDFIDWEK